MFSDDTARALLAIMEHIEGAVNMGSGSVHAIREIVDVLAHETGLADKVIWDTSKPDGQEHRAYDLSRLFSTGFRPEVELADGVARTYRWYAATAGNVHAAR
jgi:GDP-L-fucose synthase